MADIPFVGSWTYRSFNHPLATPGTASVDALCADLEGLLFGSGTTVDDGPMTVRFEGRGGGCGAQWIAAYAGSLVTDGLDGVDLRGALVGSTVHAIPRPGGDDSLHPAGAVASWYAVQQF